MGGAPENRAPRLVEERMLGRQAQRGWSGIEPQNSGSECQGYPTTPPFSCFGVPHRGMRGSHAIHDGTPVPLHAISGTNRQLV